MELQRDPPTAASAAKPPRAPGRRWRLHLLAVALGCLAGLVAGELLLRALLFLPATDGLGLAQRLRNPLHFARYSENAHWALRYALSRGTLSDVAPEFDPVVGWRGRTLIRPETYAHQDESRLEGRRPVALFGDSYAACTTDRLDCFEGLMGRSERAQDLLLWNYGIGGVGFDQVVLLLEQVLERWDGLRLPAGVQRPLVVVSIFVDDDLDRCALGLRDWPKPRFVLERGELVLEPLEVPSNQEWIARNGIGIRSYLGRYLLFGVDSCPKVLVNRLGGAARHQRDMQSLTAAILQRAHTALERRGIESFFLLLPGRAVLEAAEGVGWQTPHITRTLDALGARWIDARYEFAAHMRASGMSAEEYVGAPGTRDYGHYPPFANEIAFEALLRGIAGESDRGRGEP